MPDPCVTDQCSARKSCGNSCNSCNSSCDSCTSCLNCYTSCNANGACQSCQSSCLEKQTYCPTKQTLGDFYTGFAWNPVITANSTQMGTKTGMFNQNSWDAIITWINKRTSLPVTPKSDTVKTNNSVGGPTISKSATDDVSPFKASEYNRIYKIIHNTTNDKVNQGDQITAALFNDLKDNVGSTPINTDACKLCNSGCDNGCNECQICVFCQKCNAGSQASKCKESCSRYTAGCGSCETSTQTPTQ